MIRQAGNSTHTQHSMDTHTQIQAQALTPAEQLFALARTIESWQGSRSLSDIKLLKAYPALGSTKTYRKLVAGDASQLKVSDWLPKYEATWTLIQADIEAAGAEPTYEDLAPTHALLTTAVSLFAHRGINRLIIVEGDSGSAKSRSLAALAARHPGAVVLVEANESWKVAKAMVSEILVALGEYAEVEAITGDFASRQARLIAALNGKRVMLCIDESQHMTAQGLTIIKTLLNRTQSAFVIAGQSTLWRKLQATAWQETKQLRHNRCFAYLTFGAPEKSEVKLFVQRRAEFKTGVSLPALRESTWDLLTEHAARYGNFAFLRDTIANAADRLPAGEAIDDVTLTAAADEMKKRAGGK